VQLFKNETKIAGDRVKYAKEAFDNAASDLAKAKAYRIKNISFKRINATWECGYCTHLKIGTVYVFQFNKDTVYFVIAERS